jgi:hypothetical protein
MASVVFRQQSKMSHQMGLVGMMCCIQKFIRIFCLSIYVLEFRNPLNDLHEIWYGNGALKFARFIIIYVMCDHLEL